MSARERATTSARGRTWRERSYLVRLWRLWVTRNPRTFTEKVRYKMLRDHRRLMVTFADKAAVRAYVTAAVGAEHLPQLYFLLDDPQALGDISIPAACVIKPTHGSGVAIIVSETAPADSRLPGVDGSWVYRHIRPSNVDIDQLVALGSAWTAQLYGQGPNREWAYGHVPRRILIEELLLGPDRGVPDDYKFFVFHGVCQYIQLDRGRLGSRTQDFFTRSWTHLPLHGGHPWSEPTPAPPERLPEMIELAQRLGTGTDFVRVDLYLLRDRLRSERPGRRDIVVGELTSYPAGGDSPFDPPSFDLEFGRHWTVPRRYR
ncbi:ATP-grasp fold amidoligase family protein [uncultured Jatrophihabitans sp.]|uniref:ATP-grasp fold amidoligase family protein n=1 Tax=uncultured Jatrophihabitans sp. TaxID=1610747 RepID=UPI0035C9A583